LNRIVEILNAAAGPVPVAVARSTLAGAWRSLFAKIGFYQPIPRSEKELVCKDAVSFKGDAPLQIEGGRREQGRLAFRYPRPAFESVQQLIVTPRGGGWQAGRIYERYSTGCPGLRMLLEPHRPAKVVKTGWIVQSAHHNSYGDWVSEYLCPIRRALPLPAPLFLPVKLAARAYVRRDLERLGVQWEAITKPILIEDATVLRQQKFFVHFTRDDADMLRLLWPPAPAPARPGGIVYLSRRGDASQVAQRSYPNALIERLVEARGGKVILTATAAPSDYAAAAEFGETLVFDHGSAIYNAVGWPVRRCVEIVSDRWWNNAFLMLADALGIDDITIIRADLGEAHVESRLAAIFDMPVGDAAETHAL